MRWLCSRIFISVLVSYSEGFFRATPSGRPWAATQPGSFWSHSYFLTASKRPSANPTSQDDYVHFTHTSPISRDVTVFGIGVLDVRSLRLKRGGAEPKPSP
ncbi:hypothetical protein EYF80_023787 [Liparis tanakae]|uniref:Secreted protein n=1 Tax=Liparis tanakae TaxID=230148 RepID=A0A4Z2HKB4_9TELE|nr:hypothetical protein EYF80_023787 [Liparis tanakae]